MNTENIYTVEIQEETKIPMTFFVSPYGEEERLEVMLRQAENSAQHWQLEVIRLRARLADLAELKVS